jgi:hypothetical protein
MLAWSIRRIRVGDVGDDRVVLVDAGAHGEIPRSPATRKIDQVSGNE